MLPEISMLKPDGAESHEEKPGKAMDGLKIYRQVPAPVVVEESTPGRPRCGRPGITNEK